ncbi:hypothetical protein ACFC1R_31085 [Kitasatospora sp. NPDC056138]|uniref:hypothetical protein n=1 Tax=Kitasatospora sp. NPDC056138 TaxID=3345724 RepID=UPI0035E3356D
MGRQRNVTPEGPRKPKGIVDLVQEIVLPGRPLSDTDVLMVDEQRNLLACEAAIEAVKLAFWAAGKALQAVRDGRLYRADYSSFDAYCLERWDIQRDYADKLIRSWSLAEQLHKLAERKLNEAQVRPLVGLAKAKGSDAAETVFVAVQNGPVPVTGAVIAGAVKALPNGEFVAEEAVGHVQKYLETVAAGQKSQNGKKRPPSAENTFEARVEHAVPIDWLRKLAKTDPGKVVEFLDAVQQQLDKARGELVPGPVADQ